MRQISYLFRKQVQTDQPLFHVIGKDEAPQQKKKKKNRKTVFQVKGNVGTVHVTSDNL